MAITTADKYREVRRELIKRRNILRREVRAGIVTQEVADRRLRLWQAIVIDYERQLAQEGTQEAAK